MPAFSFSQDSTVVYYTKTGNECSRDSSGIYVVYNKQGTLWFGKCYHTANGKLQSQGTYAEMNLKIPVGDFDNYNDSGVLENSSSYKAGKLQSRTYYYPGGGKMSFVRFSDNGETAEEKGWDEKGNIIPGYVVMKPAAFKRGEQGWLDYLSRNLDATAPVDAGVPAGNYTVTVSFLVDESGKISEVKADTIPEDCYTCAVEAVRVVSKGPRWEAAIMNNKPVKYRQRQNITFQITEKKRRKKRSED
jgi:antitoxin component YwqK of YwqJK toxin-antitoxin module